MEIDHAEAERKRKATASAKEKEVTQLELLPTDRPAETTIVLPTGPIYSEVDDVDRERRKNRSRSRERRRRSRSSRRKSKSRNRSKSRGKEKEKCPMVSKETARERLDYVVLILTLIERLLEAGFIFAQH